MPSPDDVRDELADILAKVQGCEPDAVQPDRRLKEDLGVDSITIVEIGEELGRRFSLYLSDESLDGLVTVKDAINAVVHHDGATPSASSPPVPATLPVTTAPEPLLTAQAVLQSVPAVRSRRVFGINAAVHGSSRLGLALRSYAQHIHPSAFPP